MSQLRKKMIRDMQLRNLALGTQRRYIAAVAGLAKYYHQSPETIGPEQIQDYIVHLSLRKTSSNGNTRFITYEIYESLIELVEVSGLA